MKNRANQKIAAAYRPNGHQRRKETPKGPPAVSAEPAFSVERWKANLRKIWTADEKIEAARGALRRNAQDREALRDLRAGVKEKFILLNTYRQASSKDGDAESWWSTGPSYELFRNGDVAELETMIMFLERDPWFQGSGYLKEKLTRLIKPNMLSPGDQIRLRRVCLAIVNKRDGREFRSFCNLARKVDAPELREELVRLLVGSSADVQRRARWMLEAVKSGTRRQTSHW